MQVLKPNTKYKLPYWRVICSECKSELAYTRKDTIMYTHSIDGKREFFIQCPVCGHWQKTYLDK